MNCKIVIVDFISSSSSAIDFDDISLPKRTKIDTTQLTTANTTEPFTEDEVIKLHDDSRDKSQCNDSSPACSVPRLDEGQLQDYCQSLDELQNSDVDFISSSGSAIDFDDNSLPKQSKIDTTQITTAAAADTPEPSTEDEVNSKRQYRSHHIISSYG